MSQDYLDPVGNAFYEKNKWKTLQYMSNMQTNNLWEPKQQMIVLWKRNRTDWSQNKHPSVWSAEIHALNSHETLVKYVRTILGQSSNKKCNFLQINDSRKLLDAVQQEVPLLDGRLVESIPLIRAVCLQNTSNFIDLAVKLPSCNEAWQFPTTSEGESLWIWHQKRKCDIQ
jgi:hypothetical protein